MPSPLPLDHEDPNDSSNDGPVPSVTDSSEGTVAPGPTSDAEKTPPMGTRALGSGLLARQPTPDPATLAAVPKVCPQCGTEYDTASRFCVKDGAALRPKAGDDPLVGRVIADRYLVLARLGEGGMGRVYLAEHLKINRQCAVKVMNPSLVNDHESATRFAREASNAAQILHPNVAAVFDFGESDRTVYLVMEYVDGEPLSRILNQEGALEPRRAVDIACQIAEGLTAAHELGIVHRDLKPDNVIVTQARTGRDVPKIVDFGIAKAASETPQDALTRSGLVIGTPEYMSPEQLLGDPIDARTDVYSLGCILYQMLTGSTPFADESREQMIRRRLHEAPPRVRDVIPGLPRRLDATIAHMLARSPSERLASAADARSALDPGLIFAEWVPQANPVARISPPKRNSGGKRISGEKKRISGEVVDPSMQETVPIPKQRRSVRSMGVALVLAAALLVAGRALWLMKPVNAPLPDVDSAAPAPLSPSAGATTPAPESAVATKPQQRRDSNVRIVKPPPVTLADTTTPRAPIVTPSDEPLHRPIDRFRAAMATGDMAAVREVYSGAPDFASFFADIERIRGQVRFIGAPTIVDDHAELDFDLILTYEKKKSRTENTQTQIKYHALLRRESGVWHIEKLTQRN